ncbi:MAG: tRNA preQ1(34) S-adenosylmethionine ribosyltransferase-isomerase QueA [Tissierellia bacterium]|nr:tRNA preQ1(34) S-adenosylmethionine ribosyltransferase-isomerase QueA [Tissierellia bacterium]
MKTSDFSFDLPPEQIAQHPIERRDESKLLVMDRSSGDIRHTHFNQLPAYLEPGDVLVLNDTKVLPARIFGTRTSGARVEFLLLEEISPKVWRALVKPGRKARPGDRFTFGPMEAEIIGLAEDGLREVRLEYEGTLEPILDQIGTMPLPPYIHQSLEEQSRYQTIYAVHTGSSAAPTAGLHFTPELLQTLERQGIQIAKCTLHVGLGTFRPVKVDSITDHIMHEEWYELKPDQAEIINQAKRVIAVGTTSVRTLESIAAKHGRIRPDTGRTDIFIYPGYRFQVVQGMITNFHLPESTLVMLVSAFSSREHILQAYQVAIEQDYRFFSFGDAMLIL